MLGQATLQTVEFHLDESQCVGCAVCADVCPEQALTMSEEDTFPTWIAERCTNCGRCEAECPTAAIVLAALAV